MTSEYRAAVLGACAQRERVLPCSSIAVLVAIAMLALASRARAQPGVRCFTPAAGEALSAAIAAHPAVGDVPAGYSIEGIEIGASQASITLADAQGAVTRVVLEASDDDGACGFAFEPATPADARTALEPLVARLAAAVPRTALVACGSGDSASPDGSPTPTRSLEEMDAPRPRAAALAEAWLSLLAVLGALALTRRRAARADEATWIDPKLAWGTPAALELPAQLALFVGGWVAFRLMGGASPIVWLDTSNDESSVLACLRASRCTTLGQATSVHGLFHAVGWLDVRTLWSWLGLDLDHVHGLLQVLNAGAVVLVASAAARVGGRAAAGVAACVFVVLAGGMFNAQALYNTTPLFALGAVFLVICVEALHRPDAASVTLMALTGAVLASVHAGCALTLVTIVGVALRAPARRLSLAALGATVFAVAALAIGPAAWRQCIEHVWQSVVGGAGTGAEPHVRGASSLIARLSYADYAVLAAAAAYVVRVRLGARSRVIEAAAFVAVPMLLASAASGLTSAVSMNNKYLAHTCAACAVLWTTPLVLAASRLDELVRGFGERFVRVSARALPLVAALALAAIGEGAEPQEASTLTFADARATAHVLRDRRAWSWARAFASVRTPDDATFLAALDVVSPGWPLGDPPSDDTSVQVVRGSRAHAPSPLPPGWELARSDGDQGLWLVFAPAALRWSAFDACIAPTSSDPSTCAPSSLILHERPSCTACISGMPPRFDPAQPARRLELHLPLLPTPPGATRAIAMVRGHAICGGRVIRLTGARAEISEDGLHASWTPAADASTPGEIWLAWDLGSDPCPAESYSGFPPYFVDGDAETVAAIEAIRFTTRTPDRDRGPR